MPANILGSLLGIVFAVVATASLKPTSILAFITIAAWTAAPFIGALILSLAQKNNIGIGIGIYLSLLIGIFMFVDIRYWHPDPQGGIAFLVLPIIFVAIIAASKAIVKADKDNKSDQLRRS